MKLISLALPALLALSTTATPTPLTHTSPGPYNGYLSRFARSFFHGRSLQERAVGGVNLCTGPDFSGTCDYVAWPLDECIALNSFAGDVYSFAPDEGNECYLMQGRCDSEMEYADLYWNSTGLGDLERLSWIAQAESYICMTPFYI